MLGSLVALLAPFLFASAVSVEALVEGKLDFPGFAAGVFLVAADELVALAGLEDC